MKKLLFVGSLVLAAMTVRASYLYWQVEDMTKEYAEESLAGDGKWTVANLYILDSTGAKITTEKSNPIDSLNNKGENIGTTVAHAVDLSALQAGGANYSYYIELVNSNTGALVSYSNNPQTYTQLQKAGSIVTTLSEIPAAIVWHGGSFSAPEPTSAMLMMLGVAALGLRRKQRKQA